MASPSSKSTNIFVRNATVLDCAVLLPGAGPRGRSWQVDVNWWGEADAEGVLFDFSLAKKAAKSAIDDAFDHRFVVPEAAVRGRRNGRTQVASPWIVGGHKGFFAIDTYDAGLVILESVEEERHVEAPPQLRAALAEVVRSRCPDRVTRVDVRLHCMGLAHDPAFFSYTHSLRQHFGNCQRFHGHGNIIEVRDPQGNLHRELSLTAARLLDERYLVPASYRITRALELQETFESLLEVCPELAEPEIRANTEFLCYEGSQGRVVLALPRKALLLMPEESTVENIAETIHRMLSPPPGFVVVAFEGLGKGSAYP